MNTRIIILILLVILTAPIQAYANVDSREIPYTFEDRARMIKVEEKLNSIEKRFESMEKRFDGRFASIEILIYFVLGGMMSLIGFILWDRRSSLRPVENKAKEIEHTNEKLVTALREYAKKQPELLEILRINGLL